MSEEVEDDSRPRFLSPAEIEEIKGLAYDEGLEEGQEYERDSACENCDRCDYCDMLGEERQEGVIAGFTHGVRLGYNEGYEDAQDGEPMKEEPDSLDDDSDLYNL